jgi:DNA-binding NarL/FixJ family response regulator
VLVGRTAEQRRVGQVLDAARDGRASVLRLVGEPGQGKTALLADAESRAHGMTVLRAKGVPSETHVPFAGLYELLRPVLGRLDRLPGPQARALEGALALRPGRSQDRFAVGAATLGLLAAVAEESPLLVLVDDAHALDDASASALMFAVRRALADAIGVLLAARPEPSLLAEAGLPVLALSGIDRQAAGELVRGQDGLPLKSQLVDRLHRETGGNPLALLELAADPLVALGDVPPGAPLPVVPSVAEVYSRRCRSLPLATQCALLLAAAGEGSDLLVLSRAARVMGVELADLLPAEAVGLVVVESTQVTFRHPLARSAVYAEGSESARREAHRALASALPDADPDRRAWHLALAALGPDETASAALEQAGDRARARSAYDVASRAYERAGNLADDEHRQTRLWLAAADAAWLGGSIPRAQVLLDELRDRPAPVQVHADVERLRGHIATRCGPVPQARRLLVSAAEQVAEADPDKAVVLLAEAVNAAFYAGESDAMHSIAERIAALVPSSPSPRTHFFATMAQGMALLFGDDGDLGAPLVRQALAMVEPSAGLADDPLLLVWLIMGPLWLRESGAEEVVDTAMAATREQLAVGVLPFLLSHLGICRAATDRWPEAEANFNEAIELARDTGQRTDLAHALARLAWLEARQGKQACRAHAAEALALSSALELGPCQVWAHAALTDLELALGQPERALEHAEAQEQVLAQMGIHDADLLPGPELVDALLRLRQHERAAQVCDRYTAAAGAKGQPWALARAARCQGLLAADEDADALFAQALSLHARTPDVFEAARTQLAHGSRLRRAGQRVRAREPLREAVDVFDRLGAALWSDLARAELATTGETARRRHPGTARDLTPQELHLALLLASGHTTREAAAAVFLSPKTVEYHLRNVYRKLDISSRQQLARVLADHAARPGPDG